MMVNQSQTEEFIRFEFENGRTIAGEPPKPLRRQLPPAEPFCIDVLPEMLRNAASANHSITRAPLAICANSVLAVATLAIQAHADVELPPIFTLAAVSPFFVTAQKSPVCADRSIGYSCRVDAGEVFSCKRSNSSSRCSICSSGFASR
jgi:hypothetical protein